MRRSTGARALRTILEDLMMNIMYELPGRDDVWRCVVTAETVRDRVDPVLITRKERRIAS